MALALCDRCPCSASLYPPQAVLGSAALWNPLRQNFTANRALVANAPRTQFAAKFPCRCRRRRRMSADSDDFRQTDIARGRCFVGVFVLYPALQASAAFRMRHWQAARAARAV